ncbi:MAG: hypothetical protein JNK17_06780 [Hydrogenophaga sp.]|nr:hypothetical protein [Hydrogenophaga sp.]
MIYVVECPPAGEPSAWFAYHLDDLGLKIAARDPLQAWEIYDEVTPRALMEALGHEQVDGAARAAFPSVCALGDAHGWDTTLYRADYLLGRGVLSPDPVDEKAAWLAALSARAGDYRVYWSDQDAVLATEGGDDWLCAKERWRARHALHQQLLSLEVLADNL